MCCVFFLAIDEECTMGAPHATLTTLSFYFLLIGTPGSRKEVGHPATKKKVFEKTKGTSLAAASLFVAKTPDFLLTLGLF